MGEGQNSIGDLEKLALVAEAIQDIFNSKSIVIFDLSKEKYTKLISNFREVDRHHDRFSIDISGVEFHFVISEDEL